MDIVFSYLWNIPFALLISYVALTPLVKVIAKLQGYIWNKFSKNRLFVNTGGWVKETDGRKLNTFAYIDNNGIEVLSWTGKKEDGMYVFEHVCTHTADSLKHLKLSNK